MSKSRAICLLLAAVFVAGVFGDVVFLRGSLSPLDYEEALLRPGPQAPMVSLLPELHWRADLGWGDIGSGAWQMQPAQRFMAYALRHGESPYWDPYSATGMPGPETLVDVKFSAITVFTALLGGSNADFTWVLLALFVLACFAVLRITTGSLGASLPAGLAACAMFLLNGFALGNLHTAIGLPYFVAPFVLLSLLSVADRPTGLNVALCGLAHVLLFSITFLPTMVLATIAAHAIALAYGLSRHPERRRTVLLWHAVTPAVAGLALALIYLPSAETYLRYVDTWSSYNRRDTPGISLANLLTVFTPKHFWESYRAFQQPAAWPAAKLERWVHHLGMVTTLVAAHAFARRRFDAVAWTCLLLVLCAHGQIFGIFPFTVFDRLPFFSFVRNEYWPVLTCLALTVLVARGLDGLERDTALAPPALAVLALIAGTGAFLLWKLGLPEARANRIHVFMLGGILLFAVACLAWIRFIGHAAAVRWVLAAGVLAEALYAMNTMHNRRTDRDVELPPVLAWVKAHAGRADGPRILNAGRQSIHPDWGAGLQIPQLGTHDSGESPYYRELFFNHVGRSSIFPSLDGPSTVPAFTPEVLSLTGVRYVVADRAMPLAVERLRSFGWPVVQDDAIRLVFENPAPMPRAFAVTRVVQGGGLPPDRATATTEDTALLSAAIAPAADPGAVEIVEYHFTSVKLRATLRVPAVVVLTDSWHPNWRAFEHGEELHVARVDMAFRGIALPAGTHELELRYRPRTLPAALVLSALGFGLIAALALRGRREFGDAVAPITERQAPRTAGVPPAPAAR